MGIALQIENSLSLSGASAMLAMLKSIGFLRPPFISQKMPACMRFIVIKQKKLEHWQLLKSNMYYNKLNILIPFQYISGDGQSYRTQDRQTASSAMPPQSSQGEIGSFFTYQLRTVLTLTHLVISHAGSFPTEQVKSRVHLTTSYP